MPHSKHNGVFCVTQHHNQFSSISGFASFIAKLWLCFQPIFSVHIIQRHMLAYTSSNHFNVSLGSVRNTNKTHCNTYCNSFRGLQM